MVTGRGGPWRVDGGKEEVTWSMTAEGAVVERVRGEEGKTALWRDWVGRLVP